MGAERRWMVECEDLFGRSRGITVLTHGGRIVMVVPAGEAAALTRDQVESLAGALDVAMTGSAGHGGTADGSMASGRHDGRRDAWPPRDRA